MRSDVCVSAHPSRLDQALTAIEKAGGSLDRVSLAGALSLDMPVLDEFLLEMELEGHLSKNPSGRYVDTRRGNGAKY